MLLWERVSKIMYLNQRYNKKHQEKKCHNYSTTQLSACLLSAAAFFSHSNSTQLVGQLQRQNAALERLNELPRVWQCIIEKKKTGLK